MGDFGKLKWSIPNWIKFLLAQEICKNNSFKSLFETSLVS